MDEKERVLLDHFFGVMKKKNGVFALRFLGYITLGIDMLMWMSPCQNQLVEVDKVWPGLDFGVVFMSFLFLLGVEGYRYGYRHVWDDGKVVDVEKLLMGMPVSKKGLLRYRIRKISKVCMVCTGIALLGQVVFSAGVLREFSVLNVMMPVVGVYVLPMVFLEGGEIWKLLKKTADSAKRTYVQIALNIMIVVCTAIGIVIMVQNSQGKGALSSSGLENLKYFTVLSNVFCGIVALLWLVLKVMHRERNLFIPKFMAASAVGLTFLTIAAFLGPIYGHLNLYKGSNFWFHLVVPLLAMIEFVLLDTGGEKIPFAYTFLTAVPTVIYGIAYLANLLLNGVGKWPDTNDWYGFVNWGLPVGIGIFAGIVAATWGIACLLRVLNDRFNKKVLADTNKFV